LPLDAVDSVVKAVIARKIRQILHESVLYRLKHCVEEILLHILRRGKKLIRVTPVKEPSPAILRSKALYRSGDAGVEIAHEVRPISLWKERRPLHVVPLDSERIQIHLVASSELRRIPQHRLLQTPVIYKPQLRRTSARRQERGNCL